MNFAAHSKGLHLLQQVRDEAHRFAITYHRKLRSQEMARSELDGIPGIGPKRKKALLDSMGDVERIRKASLEELRSITGMNEKAARSIWDRFHPAEGPDRTPVAKQACWDRTLARICGLAQSIAPVV